MCKDIRPIEVEDLTQCPHPSIMRAMTGDGREWEICEVCWATRQLGAQDWKPTLGDDPNS